MHLLHPADLLKLSFGSKLVQKIKACIYEMLLSNMDFNFAYFATFHLAHFEIEESFELIWVKLPNG